jgi:polyisoprenoid-binding protein YceI
MPNSNFFRSTLGIVVFMFATSPWAASAADPLKADMEKCKITFVGHKADGKHEGGFKKFDIEAKADFDDPSKSSLKIEIQTESLWSDDDGLTKHLKNPDFFDVRNFPKIVFESTAIEHSEEGKATITGKMTMLKKTEELKVPAQVKIADTTVTITAKFKLDRTKWGMDFGKGKIKDEVDVVAEMAFKR